MSLLTLEMARLTAQLQTVDAEIAGLGQQLLSAQEAASAAQQRVAPAQAALHSAQSRLPGLEAAAGQADARVAEIDLQIAEAQQEPMPERANLIRNLMKLRNTAQREAANARLQLQSGHSEVQQASTDLLAARGAADAAVAAAQAAQAAMTGAGQRRTAIQEQTDRIAQWSAQIAADPLDRPALEQTVQTLAGKTAELDDARDRLRIQLDYQNDTLPRLTARRDLISPAFQAIAAELGQANVELQAAQDQLQAIGRQLAAKYKGGPRR